MSTLSYAQLARLAYLFANRTDIPGDALRVNSIPFDRLASGTVAKQSDLDGAVSRVQAAETGLSEQSLELSALATSVSELSDAQQTVQTAVDSLLPEVAALTAALAETNQQLAHALPVGTIVRVASNTPPEGFLACGTTVSRTQYPELFALIGTTYGSGDTVNTFDLPAVTDSFLNCIKY